MSTEDYLVGENKTFRHLVKLAGDKYQVDSHVVTTNDGCILKIFRIRDETV